MSPLFWIAATFLCVVLEAFYCMMEMACVSFNRVRLQFHLSRGDRRAGYMNYLLERPELLFGTTLVGANATLVIGSECSRMFYSSVGLNPSLAPITQFFVVLVFAELAPMFAARRYAEHVGMLGVRPLYFSAMLMRPMIATISAITTLIYRMIGAKPEASGAFFSREELQTLVEEQDDAEQAPAESLEFNRIVGSIFALRGKTVETLVQQLDSVPLLPSNATVSRMRQALEASQERWVALYHRDKTNIIGIAQPRDVLRIPDHRQVRDFAGAPWFITQNTKLTSALHQFRVNSKAVAVVLNKEGGAIGVLTLDAIMEDLFGAAGAGTAAGVQQVIERSFPGETSLADFKKQFNTEIATGKAETLSELMRDQLGHHPQVGESIRVGIFEFKAKEVSLLGTKVVTVRSLLE